MYDRNIEDKTLHFEASGALLDASLVMRDRETDSWWSIMTSDSIGGDLEGSQLMELPGSEKTQWADWVSRHPDTLVLSINGVEHLTHNPYSEYFSSNDTFRNLPVTDRRLEPKTPVFTFHLDDSAFAIPHGSFDGGRVFHHDSFKDRALLLFREAGSSIFSSSESFLVPASLTGQPLSKLIDLARAGDGGIEPIGGFDTFWYNWVAVNKSSELLR